jgi:hypothetical protein
MFKQTLDKKGVRLDIDWRLCKYAKEKEAELRVKSYQL